MEAVMALYDRIVDQDLLVRRITVAANHLADETAVHTGRKECALQEAVLSVKKKFGKNAILKGMNMEEGATGTQRNNQIGGHRA